MKTINFIQNLALFFALLVPFLWSTTFPQWILWDISWYAVVFVMAIRPLADLFPNFPLLRQLVILRKGFGILSAIVIVTNFAYTYIPQWEIFPQLYFQTSSWGVENMKIFARLGEITGLILLVTSNTWSMQLLGKWWKRIQRLAYIYFLSGGIYLFSIGKMEGLYGIIFVIIVWMLARIGIKILK